MQYKDLHTTISNVLNLTLIGVLGSTLTVKWWMCGDDKMDIFRAWLLGICMGITGLGAAYATLKYKNHEKFNYWSEVVLRVLLVYAVFTTALLKAEGHFYNYTLFTGETKLAQLEADTFANAFYGFSPIFQAYIGYIILGGLALICFRQTQRLGNILMFAILANTVMHNYSFDSCYIYKNSIYLAVIGSFIFADFPAYYSFFSRQNNKLTEEYHPLKNHYHLINSGRIFKVILLIGFYFYTQHFIEDAKNYMTSNIESPITGVWKITDIKFMKEGITSQNRKDIQSFKSIILDKGRFGAVEIADSLSFFEYIIDPKYNQLEFWNFQDFWELNIKGKYHQVTPDSMIYIGSNKKDSLQFSLKLDIKK
ncbi:MAG: hypothetical protein P1U56_01680 [Saprospiraceae bacterium]|nr:hypothetical protein [Saprospiraceae bacterium]